MAKHSTSRLRSMGARLRSTRARAVLSLGVVLGFGAVSTLAYWTDSATLTSGTFTSGTLNLKLDGTNDGNPTPYTKATITAANLQPGESVAFPLTVDNTGSIKFTYTATGTASGTLAGEVSYAVTTASTPSNAGAQATGDRVGTCSAPGAGGAVGPTVLLNGTSAGVVTGNTTVNAGASQNVCILATLPTSAPDTAQGKTETATFVFSAKQVGAP